MATAKTKNLPAFLVHDTSFHDFSPAQAAQIRERLLVWYDKHRRKLPWRGDPPPWQGSTAKISKKPASSSSKQSKLTAFFATNETKPTTDTPLSQQQRTYPVTAYGVWVSEIMLQQTRVEAVLPKWCAWMDAFPTLQTLAQASPDQVNAHWAGLGFYRRARLLHAASKMVVDDYNATVPDTVEELLKLPGIGRYTASAIASIVFSVPVPVVDGNVCRVLSRLRGIANNIKDKALKDQHGWTLAAQLISSHRPGCVNQALMELGATYCAPSGTGVDPNDPLRDFYVSTQLGEEVATVKRDGFLADLECQTDCAVCASNGAETVLVNLWEQLEDATDTTAARKCGHSVFPLPPEKKAKKEQVLAVGAICCLIDGEEAWLMTKRPDKGLLAGQWEFPNACVWTSEPSKKRKDMSDKVPTIAVGTRRKALDIELQELLEDSIPKKRIQVAQLEHVFSHVRHTMWVEFAEHTESRVSKNNVRWMTRVDMKNVGVTSGVHKILNAISKYRAQQVIHSE